jgi:hypothetical protein
MTRKDAVRCAPAVLAVLAVLLGACSGETELAPKATVFDPDEPPLPGGVRVLSRDVNDFVEVDRGRYGVRVSDSLVYQVDVPAASEVFGGEVLNPGSLDTGRNGILYVETADEDTALALNPCHDHTLRGVGPTVEDLARALSAEPFVTVTKPMEVTVGGMKGLFVKVAMPEGAELSACQDGKVQLLGDIDDRPDGDNGWENPEIVERMWILDIGGVRHVIHANVFTGPTAADPEHQTRALTRMVESMAFTERPAGGQ